MPKTDSSELIAMLKTAKTVWLTTHQQADGDGLACEAAMAAALKNRGVDVKIMNFEMPGSKYRFLFENATEHRLSVRVFEPDLTSPPPDIVIAFDTNEMRLLEPLSGWMKAHRVPVLIVDHHEDSLMPSGSSEWKVANWTNKALASSGEVLLSLLDQLEWPLSQGVATALYASLVFDTQNFRFIRASANSHKMAARLLPLVSEPERIHESLLANLTAEKLGFISQALSLMRIEAEGHLAVVVLKRDLFVRYGADPSDSGDVIDMALNVHSVKIAILFREESHDEWKISLRSKRGFSILQAAETLGGGGHRHSAGAIARGQVVEIEERIKPLLLEEIRKSMFP